MGTTAWLDVLVEWAETRYDGAYHRKEAREIRSSARLCKPKILIFMPLAEAEWSLHARHSVLAPEAGAAPTGSRLEARRPWPTVRGVSRNAARPASRGLGPMGKRPLPSQRWSPRSSARRPGRIRLVDVVVSTRLGARRR